MEANSEVTGSWGNQLIYPENKITTVKFGDDNFLLWKFQVLAALDINGLEEHINEDSEITSQFLPNTQQVNSVYTSWKRQDRLIMSWLLGSMSEETLSDLLHCTTTKEVWNNLHQMFATESIARTMELRTKLQNMKKGNLSLNDYMRQIKNLIDRWKINYYRRSHPSYSVWPRLWLWVHNLCYYSQNTLDFNSRSHISVFISWEQNGKETAASMAKDPTLPSVDLARQANTIQNQMKVRELKIISSIMTVIEWDTEQIEDEDAIGIQETEYSVKSVTNSGTLQTDVIT